MIGCEAKAYALVERLQNVLEDIRAQAAKLPRHPRVYFEEWDEPQISCIAWVSELIGIAGGEDSFPELAKQALGKNRIIADPQEVVRRQPDIIIGSWCGKKFQPQAVATARMACHTCGTPWRVARSEILPHPATGASCPDRRRVGVAADICPLGRSRCCSRL